MLIACWSAKGGCGTSVVAAALALTLSSCVVDDVLLVDLCGDQPSLLGLRCDGTGAVGAAGAVGVAEWLAAGDGDGALQRHEVEVRRGLHLLTAGSAGSGALDGDGDGAERLLSALSEGAPVGVAGGRPVVIDCGLVDGGGVHAEVAASAPTSLLVMRPCYLALRRAMHAPLRPSGVVLVAEPGRALDAIDVEDALGVPVLASLRWSPEVARAVDAGLLTGRLPRCLSGPLRRFAP